MKILLQVLFLFMASSNVYAGCGDIYPDYNTKIMEKYNIDIGRGRDIYIVLRCTSDCYNLTMGGSLNGSASLCGATKPEGGWSYHACGGGNRSASYGTDVSDVAGLMMDQCNDIENRKIDRQNDKIHRDNERIRKENKQVFLGYIETSNKLKAEAEKMLSAVNVLIKTSDNDEAISCFKKSATTFNAAISKLDKSVVEYNRGIRAKDNMFSIGEKGLAYYNSASKDYDNSTTKANLCVDGDYSDKTQKKTVTNSKDSGTLFSVTARPHLNIRSNPSTKGSIVSKAKFGASVTFIEYGSGRLTISGNEGRWMKIRHNDQIGYIFDFYLKKIKTNLSTVEYQKSAEEGDASAQYKLGNMLFKGEGVTQDKATAVLWFRKSAEQGFAKAQSSLGTIYFKGEEVTQDKATAVKWYLKAAEQGFAKAQFNLGLMYEIGEGVSQDNNIAVKWYIKAAKNGDVIAQNKMGTMYQFGKGVIKNQKSAVKWYQKAADQGNALSQNNLAYMYFNGEGITQDKIVAAKWYKKAAEKGDASAQYNLGKMLSKGDGITQDKVTGAMWYKRAAEQGHSEAQKNLVKFNFDYLFFSGEGETSSNNKVATNENYQNIPHKNRFYDNGNGTITDNDTNLMWKKCVEGLSGKKCSHGEAETFKGKGARNFKQAFAGFDDWSLPSRKELHTLVHCSKGRSPIKLDDEDTMWGGKCLKSGYVTPTINSNYFPNTPEKYYWTTTIKTFDTLWAINFFSGNEYVYSDEDDNYVRLVRSTK